MAVDPSVVQQELDSIPRFNRAPVGGLIKSLHHVLEPGEKLKSAMGGMHDNRRCLVLLSDRRIAVVGKRMLKKPTAVSIPLESSSSSEFELGIFSGKATFRHGGTKAQVTSVSEAELENFAKLVPREYGGRPEGLDNDAKRKAALFGALCVGVVLVVFASKAPNLGMVLAMVIGGVGAMILARRIDPTPLAPIFQVEPEDFSRVAVGLILGTLSIAMLGTAGSALSREAEQVAAAKAETERRAEKLATEREAKAKHLDQLRARAPEMLASATEQLAEVESQEQAEKFGEAYSGAQSALGRLQPLHELSPAPQRLREIEARLRERMRGIEPIVTARRNAAEAEGLVRHAVSMADIGQFVDAERELTKAIQQWEAALPRAKYLDSDPRPKMRAAQRKLKGIARQAARQREREARAKAKAEAERRRVAAAKERCGPEPLRSAWDGVFPAEESYLEDNANDPDSIEVESCSPLGFDETRCWHSTCKFRGKNGFGGMVVNVGEFYMGKHPQGLARGIVTRAQIY